MFSVSFNPDWCVLTSRLLQRLQSHRSFVNARVKWMRDPWLDHVVEREKNLQAVLAIQSLLLSSPTKALPVSTVSTYKRDLLRLPVSADTSSFIQKYPSFFQQFRPQLLSIPHVKLTQEALSVYKEEAFIHSSPAHRQAAAERLTKLLMLTGAGKLPLHIIDMLRFDLGLPHNYILALVSYYPDYFEICRVNDYPSSDSEVFGLGLVRYREDLALSILEKKAMSETSRFRKGMKLQFPVQYCNGFEHEKRVKIWMEEWQNLPYISPYEDAFHLNPHSDQAEKWTVAVLHELFHLLVSKKIEIRNLCCLAEYLGFDWLRLKKALKHHPGIFYISNKIRTQTVVLREAYRKDILLEKHPLMGVRHRYIHLMSKKKKRKSMRKLSNKGRAQIPLHSKGRRGETDDRQVEKENIKESSEPEYETFI
ncbi:hypothetical protein QQ045_029010 [Rhodiola kirilowii]